MCVCVCVSRTQAGSGVLAGFLGKPAVGHLLGKVRVPGCPFRRTPAVWHGRPKLGWCRARRPLRAAHHWGEEWPPQYPSSPSVGITGIEQSSLHWTLGSQEASSPGDVCFSLCRLHTAEQDTMLRPAASPPYECPPFRGSFLAGI